jgi:CarD family transcriptional regulator
MDYKVGSSIVYPHHGAAVIFGTTTRSINGVEYEMFVASPVAQQLKLYFRQDKVEELGIRKVVDREEAEEILNSYFVTKPQKNIAWSRRFKNRVENLKSGDIYQIAEVVRELAFSEKPLSMAEKRQFLDASRRLCSELCLSLGKEYEAIVDMLYSHFPDQFVNFISPSNF